MEESLVSLFGRGNELSELQMSARGLVVFFYTLLLIRISGRRSFGFKTAFDSIIVILLGTILGRAIVGAAPFVAVLSAGLVIALTHRILGWAASHSRGLWRFLAGEKILVYQNGKFLHENLRRALLSEEDVMQGVRTKMMTDDLSEVSEIYMENTGKVSVVRKAFGE